MEKLLNLINEYHYANSEVCKYLYNDEAKKIYFRTMLEDGDTDEERIDDEWIISKRFGFIKWLVENDKIDTKKVAERRKEDGWSIVNYNHDEEQKTKETMIEYWVDNTLMALSISDTPIQDLCVWLK